MVVLLIITNPDRLLTTIRARCLSIRQKPVQEKAIRDYILNTYDVDEEKASFVVEYAQGNLGKAIILVTNSEYEELIQSVINLQTNIYNMGMDEISEAIQYCSTYKMSINDYLDLMMMWYRDILVLKVTGNPDRILFKEQYSIISDQSKYLSFNELEDKKRAIEAAKERINANASMEDIMKLLILTLKEH